MSKKKSIVSSEGSDESIRQVKSLQKQIRKLRPEHDIPTKANELLGKDQGISPQNLSNRERTLLIGALRTTYRLPELLEQLQMPCSSYFYRRVAAATAREVRLAPPDYHRGVRREQETIRLPSRPHGAPAQGGAAL